ncbi:hypothetical protein HRbin06_00581 [archaeon HR06]|nr:hypothetical protein HRbin06_00581 [archaeon HR06]
MFRVVKKVIEIPEDLYIKINESKERFDDIPNFTQTLLELIKKGLESEGNKSRGVTFDMA